MVPDFKIILINKAYTDKMLFDGSIILKWNSLIDNN